MTPRASFHSATLPVSGLAQVCSPLVYDNSSLLCKHEIILQASSLQLAFSFSENIFLRGSAPFFLSSHPGSFCQRGLYWFGWSFSGKCLGCFWIFCYYWQCYNAHTPLTFSLNINFDCASASCIYFPCQIVEQLR